MMAGDGGRLDYDDDDELQMSLDDELALAENMLNEIQ
jgi:hypothetical protein